ncbi:hypothetical protein [Fodinicola feengrottensis]|uniref:hypothetical protein n=1 Tax=Fodinicola feengrottensis TaxID=435914 RepID=UPI0024432543|nr:hypothetical protein [Fodinicola feengrottensis]
MAVLFKAGAVMPVIAPLALRLRVMAVWLALAATFLAVLLGDTSARTGAVPLWTLTYLALPGPLLALAVLLGFLAPRYAIGLMPRLAGISQYGLDIGVGASISTVLVPWGYVQAAQLGVCPAGPLTRWPFRCLKLTVSLTDADVRALPLEQRKILRELREIAGADLLVPCLSSRTEATATAIAEHTRGRVRVTATAETAWPSPTRKIFG